MTLSAIVVTINRPDCVRRCIECLLDQEPAVEQIIVCDASKDRLTRAVCEEYPEVLYLRHELGEAQTTYGRNLGLKRATGDVIAFLDDDSFVRPGWAEELLKTYGDDPNIGAVGGRALRGTPGESHEGVNEIGLLTENGSLTGNFGADPGRVLEVDHLIGCNMSFRREVLARLGGFRSGFETRYCIREESDIFLIMRRLGYRILFQPAAVVDHVGAPKPTGQRFDVSWDYFGHRNHYVLLMRNFGVFSTMVLRFFFVSLLRAVMVLLRELAKAIIRFCAVLRGTLAGIGAGVYHAVKQGADPVRRDRDGREISEWLGKGSGSLSPAEAVHEDSSH